MKVSFFGHFGSTNPGNESTLLAILSRLRTRLGDAEFHCICTEPRIAEERYGIAATAITTREARLWDHDVSVLRRVPRMSVALVAELREYARAYRELTGTDVLIVPGTGLLTDAYGLAGWGPYSLFKWCLLARLRGCRVQFVSVGAGPIYGTAGRALVRAALSLAGYRSYRDASSRDYLTGISVATDGDEIYPDLAFSLSDELVVRDQVVPEGGRRVVGLGLMEYPGRYSSADPQAETYSAYLQSLATFAAWLLEHDYDIRLLLGDADTIAIEHFRAALREQLGHEGEGRIVEQPMDSVHDVLAGLAASDVVVATRFHNVLLALLFYRPVLAISFHPKCSSLMREMKLSRYCHDIETMDAERLIAQFRELEDDRDGVRRTIAGSVAGARAALDAQYDVLLGDRTRSAARRPVRDRIAHRVETGLLRVNEPIWRRLPAAVRDRRPGQMYGAWLHGLVRRRSDREMYLGTQFLRNRPALELMRRLTAKQSPGGHLKIAILGCSVGVEVYSILWILRSSRPDLTIEVHALDISPDVVRVAERGVYDPAASDLVSHPIFQGLTETERREIFDWDGEQGTVKAWLREGITWQVADAADPDLVTSLGTHDVVVASNFLCHMPPPDAHACLHNLSRLVGPGGYLFVTGVDLDVRTQVAVELGWEPISELRAEIHDGDPLLRGDWPWRWWGLEPLDQRRPQWETRYTAAFRLAAGQ